MHTYCTLCIQSSKCVAPYRMLRVILFLHVIYIGCESWGTCSLICSPFPPGPGGRGPDLFQLQKLRHLNRLLGWGIAQRLLLLLLLPQLSSFKLFLTCVFLNSGFRLILNGKTWDMPGILQSLGKGNKLGDGSNLNIGKPWSYAINHWWGFGIEPT